MIYVVDLIRFRFELSEKEFFDIESVAGIIVGQVLVVWVLCDVVLVQKEGTDAAKLENALAVVHHRQFIHGPERLTQHFLNFLERSFSLPAQENHAVTVTCNRVGIVLVQLLYRCTLACEETMFSYSQYTLVTTCITSLSVRTPSVARAAGEAGGMNLAKAIC